MGLGDRGGSGRRGGAHPMPRLRRGRARTWVVTTRIWARTVGCTHVAPSQDVRAVSQDQLQTSRQMGSVTTTSISVGVAAANKCAGERVRGGGEGGWKVYWMVGACYLLSHLAVRRHNHGHRSAACGHAKKRKDTQSQPVAASDKARGRSPARCAPSVASTCRARSTVVDEWQASLLLVRHPVRGAKRSAKIVTPRVSGRCRWEHRAVGQTRETRSVRG